MNLAKSGQPTPVRSHHNHQYLPPHHLIYSPHMSYYYQDMEYTNYGNHSDENYKYKLYLDGAEFNHGYSKSTPSELNNNRYQDPPPSEPDYCTISNDSSPRDFFHFSDKSPKTAKIETKLLPVSAKIGCDV
jgi:hypothetical protein